MINATHTTIKTAEKSGLDLEGMRSWMVDFGWTMIARQCQYDSAGIVTIYTDRDLNKTTFYAVTIKCECGEKFGGLVATEVNHINTCPNCQANYEPEEVNLLINYKLLLKLK